MTNSFDLTPALDAYGHLWMAVLRQAIDDATIEPITLEGRRARLWLRQRVEHVGSLQWICDVLHIEIDSILAEFTRRTSEGGIQRRRRAVPFAYHKRS